MIARTKQVFTTTSDVVVMSLTCGSVVTFGVISAVCSSRPHSMFSASRTRRVSQSMAELNNQPIAGALRQDALQRDEQDGCEDRQGVADAGGLERRLGLL